MAKRGVPSVKDPALAELVDRLASWMGERAPSVRWDDVYDCLRAHGHNLRNLRTRGKALQMIRRRYKDGMAALPQ